MTGDETWGLEEVSASATGVNTSFDTSFDRKYVLGMGDPWAYKSRGCDQDEAE